MDNVNSNVKQAGNAKAEPVGKASATSAIEAAPERFNSKLVEYLRGKGFASLNTDHLLLPETGYRLATFLRAASILANNYEVGVGLAWGGAPISFAFQSNGLPVRLVRAKRRNNEVEWGPIDSLDEESIRGKRILVLEVDVLAGRTLTRALKELERFKPAKIDVILELGHTIIPISKYDRMKADPVIGRKMPTFKEAFDETVRVLNMDFGDITKIELDHQDINVYFNDGEKKTLNVLFVDLKRNIPNGFGRVMTLDDFRFFKGEKLNAPLTDLERGMMNGMRTYGEYIDRLILHYLRSLE